MAESSKALVQEYLNDPRLKAIGDFFRTNEYSKAHISGTTGSFTAFALAASFRQAERPHLLIASDKEEAAYLLNDLEAILGDKHVMFYPGSYRRPYQVEETDNANVLLRAEVKRWHYQ